MGFTTGLLGGFTLTASVIYLSMRLHTQNRVYQSSLLHQQAIVLDNIIAPRPPQPPPTSREVQAGLWETAKDKWNAELESNVKKLQTTDWAAVRERLEENVSTLYQKAFKSGREGVEFGVEKTKEGIDTGIRNASDRIRIIITPNQETKN
ncbi:hypothetical protein D0869_06403, partial [Lecanosticta acicola]